MRLLAFLAGVFLRFAAQAVTIRIAFIDPLSGPAAAVTQNGLNHFRFMAERLSDARLKFEVTGYDNKLSPQERSEEHTSELQSLMRISYAVFCLKKKKKKIIINTLQVNPRTTIDEIEHHINVHCK